jgi:triosephosphate isomerase (TIM)
MRRPLVAANWKMNLNLPSIKDLVKTVRSGIDSLSGVEVAICPPAIYLFHTAGAIAGSPLRLGAQNIYFEPAGAFTGEISAAMVVETGATYVILGHSERRHTIGHHEDDWMINRKMRAALAAGLTPILCVGETLEERKAGRTLEVLDFQIVADLLGVAIERADRLVVAYEPVWAIGTGQNATPAQAQEIHAHIRGKLRDLLGNLADETRILYGGSVKPDNAREIMIQPDVDGGLIGGASLKAETFLPIVLAAAK